MNAKGVPSFSPGLPEATLGVPARINQPQRGCVHIRNCRATTPLAEIFSGQIISHIGAAKIDLGFLLQLECTIKCGGISGLRYPIFE